MSKVSRKLIDELVIKWTGLETAIDLALDKDITTGYAICENDSGEIHLDSATASDEGANGLNLRCVSHGTKLKGSIVITPL